MTEDETENTKGTDEMGLFDGIKNIKNAMKMRTEGKRIQDKINAIEETYENGGIAVRVRGDMTVVSITIAQAAYDEVKAGKTARFETMLLNTVNGAFAHVKKTIQEEMRKMLLSGEMQV